MLLHDAKLMAEKLMREHGISPARPGEWVKATPDGVTNDWRFEFDSAKVRAGVCKRGERIISLSRSFVMLNDEEKVRGVVLHEIAHALTPGHGHDRVWKMKCLAIGASPERCLDSDTISMPKGKYVYRCPNGHEVTYHRRPKKLRSCAICSPWFDKNFLLRNLATV